MSISISDLEPIVHDLRACATILDAMITQAAVDHSFTERESYAWRKLESDFLHLTQQTIDMWQVAFEERRAKIERLKSEHATEVM